MGGIVNIQTKEFFEEHMALLESMAKAGEATSAPVGTRTDKRTAATTFNNMERRGRIKQLKTAIMTHTGVRRPACIIYLPTIEQEKLNAFLADLARGIQPPPPQQGAVLKLDERVEYGADPTSIARGALPLQLLQMEEPGTDRKERWSKNVARANQLFSYEDNVVREVLLTERTTLGQLYGFIVGKVVRARALHLSALGAFDTRNPSSNIISHNRRIVDVSFFVHDIPLGLYCSLVSSLSHDEELTRFLATDQGRQTLARDIPSNLNFLLQIGRSRARSRFLDILEMLRALKLVTPLQPSTSGIPWITCEPVADRPNAFDLASLDGWTVSTPMAAPVYWHFNDVASLHVWAASEVGPPFWQDVPVACRAEGLTYWSSLQEACTNPDIITPRSVSIMGPPSEEISVARSLRRTVSWNADYILTWHQMQYMRQFTEPSTAHTPLQDEDGGEAQIQKISWVISAPQDTVRVFFETTHEKFSKELQKARRKAERQTTEKRAKRAAAAKASLAKKAAAARNQREEEWESMLFRLHPMPLEGAASVRVRRVRTRFLQAGSTKDIQKWDAEVKEALREADTASKQVLKVADKRTFVSRTVPVPVAAPPAAVANPPEKSIQALIAQQGPALMQKDSVKRKRKIKDVEGSFLIKINASIN
jgi:transcription factor C subunit 3